MLILVLIVAMLIAWNKRHYVLFPYYFELEQELNSWTYPLNDEQVEKLQEYLNMRDSINYERTDLQLSACSKVVDFRVMQCYPSLINLAFSDKDPNSYAAIYLGQIDDISTVPLILEAYDNCGSPHRDLLLARSLSKKNNRAAFTALKRLSSSKDLDARELANLLLQKEARNTDAN